MVYEISKEGREQIAATIKLSPEGARERQAQLEDSGFTLEGAVTTVNKDPSFVIKELSHSLLWAAAGEVAIGPHRMRLPDGSLVQQVGLWHREQESGEVRDVTIDQTT